jgi:NadR type nicotinamide-nucleotide adenylyltransferase
MTSVSKIVVIGPESTGKSTLCELLASHYHTRWVPEFARSYLLAHGTGYSYENLLDIAHGQISGEEGCLQELAASPESSGHKTPLFIDTDMYVMKVWCEFVFNDCHHWIIDQIVERKYDLYLLCNIDLPWAADPLREYPDQETRGKLFHIYRDLLINQETAWLEIQGNNENRFESAKIAVDRILA